MTLRIIFVGLMLMTFLNATDIDKIAENFISYQSQSNSVLSKEVLSKNSQEIGFLYHLSPSGYIIIPKELIASPIKAFSFQTNFYDLPKPYQTFLLNELYGYVMYSQSRTLAKTLTPSDAQIQERWDFLENYVNSTQDLRVLKSYIPNTFLIKSTWNQGYPYNKVFPKVGEDLTVTGCVQTAIAQVMKYHKHPQRGSGVYEYNATIEDASKNPAYTTALKTILNKYYNWDIMPDTITSEVKEYQTDEISYLMRDLAIANNAYIGVSGTSTLASADILVSNFGYSNTLSYISTDYASRTEFLDILKAQLDQEMPMLFSLPGHMVVADGYKDDFSGHFIHLNMGWGGAYNNFYDLDETVNAGGYLFYTTSLDLIYNIKPCTSAANDCSPTTQISSFPHIPQIDMETKDKLITGEEIIRINAYDEDEKDTPTFKAFANEYFDVNFTNNLLHVKPKMQNAMSDIVVQVTSPDGVAEKTFKVASVAEPLSFGKQFEINGLFESQTDFNKHKAILQGTCSISGDRGYSNQAFYISLLNQNSIELISRIDDSLIAPSLSLNQYLIGASIGYYSFTAGNAYSNYTLTVSCPEANGTIESIIPLLGTLLYKPTITDGSNYTAMPISQGWQLLSFPVVATLDTDTLKTTFAQSDILWKYLDTHWYALGVTSNLQTALDTNAIPAIETLGNEEGFWIYTSQNDYNATLSSTASFDVNITSKLGANTQKWQLLGNGQEKGTQPFLDQNASIKALWSFENNQWKVISNDFNLTTIEKLQTLKKGQGFWLEKR